MRVTSLPQFLLIPLLALAGGCESAPKPIDFESGTIEKSLHGPGAAESIQARCRLTLTDANGKTIAFNGALVGQGSDHVRVRTWKFTRPVMDVTVVPSGLWVEVGSVVKGSARAELQASARDIARAWRMFRSETSEWGVPMDVAGADEVETRYLTLPDASGNQILTVVDRRLGAPTRHEVRDADGSVLRTLSLDQFKEVDGIAWPHRMTFENDQGTIVLVMSAVALNVVPKTGAFVPPEGAHQLE